MFDISFSELFVIAVVALLVIGPEKLPKVARTAGAFIGRLQRYTAQVKDEVNREMRFEELQKLQREMQSNTAEIQSSIMAPMQQAVSEVATVEAAGQSAHQHSPSGQQALATQPKRKSSKPKVETSLLNDQTTPISSRKRRAKKPATN